MALQSLAACAVLTIVFATSPNILPRGDSHLTVATAVSLVHDQDVDISEFLDSPGVADHHALRAIDGRHIDYFPWLTAVFAVPIVIGVDATAGLGLNPTSAELVRQDRSWIVQTMVASLLSAAAAVIMALIARALLPPADARMGRRTGPRWLFRFPVFFAAMAIGCTSPLWSVASRSLTQHAPAMLAVSAALLLALSARNWRVAALAGAVGGCAIWIRPTTAVCLVGILALVLWARPRLVAPMAAAAVATSLAALVANDVLTGSMRPLYFSGDRVGWHSQLPEAAAAHLFSPSRGLLVFCPQLLVLAAFLFPRFRDRTSVELRRFGIIAAAVSGGLLVAVSSYGHQWWAGHTYGPRYMIEALPFLLPLAAVASVVVLRGARGLHRSRDRAVRLLVVCAWVAAGVVHWQGAWFHSTQCWNGAEPPSRVEPRRLDIDEDPSRVWEIGRPQLLSGFDTLIHDGPAAASWRACEQA